MHSSHFVSSTQVSVDIYFSRTVRSASLHSKLPQTIFEISSLAQFARAWGITRARNESRIQTEAFSLGKTRKTTKSSFKNWREKKKSDPLLFTRTELTTLSLSVYCNDCIRVCGYLSFLPCPWLKSYYYYRYLYFFVFPDGTMWSRCFSLRLNSTVLIVIMDMYKPSSCVCVSLLHAKP